MATNTIDVQMLARMFLAGAQRIEAKKEFINELNVFPVPDGDTGTNMSLTIMSAAKEVTALTKPDIFTLSKAISSGSLRGARGNSGVILSQLLRGFTKAIREEPRLDTAAFANAAKRAKETAYKAVMKPKEGTILTVARGIADKAEELAMETDDLEIFFPEIIKHAQKVLEKTPDMLPVLKDAGVVDSGGQGLLEILQGGYEAFLGKEIDYDSILPSESVGVRKISDKTVAEIKFGYCTEFIILLKKDFAESDEEALKTYLASIGDSIVCVSDEDVVKVHVHTNDPGLAIQKGLSIGQLSRMKIDNMREEHEEVLIKDAERIAVMEAEKQPLEPRKPIGFIAVSIGTGLNQIFGELGVDFLIEGGQTMNPSTDDILQAIDEVNADTIFILPNNKNIVLAANQAKNLVKDKDIRVIPTHTIPQGITAVINYAAEVDADTNEEVMLESIKQVKNGQVTFAIRDTTIDGKEIHEGDIMGIGDDGILSVSASVEETVQDIIAQLVDDESELISLYYGEEVRSEEAQVLTEKIEKKYPDVDVDTHYGGQPIYYYVLAVE
ncbi:MAG: DAK2 domain-containing protein [Lachnospiraceae bacterium]